MILPRIFAAVILLGFAIGSSLFWNDGQVEWVSLLTNLAAACIGFIFLHFRWRATEQRAITPKKAQDIFS